MVGLGRMSERLCIRPVLVGERWGVGEVAGGLVSGPSQAKWVGGGEWLKPGRYRRWLCELDAALVAPPPPAPIVLDTPQQRRAFYMRLIFQGDFLLRRIVHFL